MKVIDNMQILSRFLMPNGRYLMSSCFSIYCHKNIICSYSRISAPYCHMKILITIENCLLVAFSLLRLHAFRTSIIYKIFSYHFSDYLYGIVPIINSDASLVYFMALFISILTIFRRLTDIILLREQRASHISITSRHLENLSLELPLLAFFNDNAQ